VSDPAPSRPSSSRTFVIGDVHGQADVVKRILRDAGLVDLNDRWTGGDATLWFTGDFCDRGTDGVAAIDLVMSLEPQAQAAGGAVRALLGNHDVLILAVDRFRAHGEGHWGNGFMIEWLRNGGWMPDLHALTPRHVRWLSHLPALAKVGRVLLAHADATFYLDHGRTIGEVNRSITRILQSDGAASWHQLFEQFSERRTFTGESPGDGNSGAARARQFLRVFDAERLVHGHTPIPLLKGVPPDEVRGPHVYADGLCVNVDAGLFLGSPGFLFELPSEWLRE
jgi:hypothetical protein